uniref:Small ribosomal subunit protein uS8c n=1 Tax=Mankyua chejuensis TaxID=996148 RepID=H8Y650_9MONI|nr:ribosomal protein S8 [Mankyua chejuensis]ADZ48018.1 ribosomal protein S8 [Mankyua chejuensis]AJJ48649.1 ribosomal protein S8 [Mankyua chejuensis]
MGNDIVANMITSVRNANVRKAVTVKVPATSTTKSIGMILLQEGFIENIREHKNGIKSFLTLTLKYQGRRREPHIKTLKRVSKPGLRIYSNHREIPEILGGMGIAILSTSSGIITNREARQKRIGGEILCYIW